MSDAQQAPATVPEATGTEPKYTLESLKEHGTRESCWMLLNDKVYDVTQFLDEHPGGDEVMLEEAGRDATESFEDVGHSDEARAMLPKMLLGDFHRAKTSKAKKAAAATGTTVKSSSGFPTWVLPIGVFAVYLAWRVFYA